MAYQWRTHLGLAPKALSLVDINAIPITLAASIVEHCKVLYCNDGLRLAREENRIAGLMADYHYLKRS